jgi:hypothetical protein
VHKEVYGHLSGGVGDIDDGDMVTEATLYIDRDGWWDALILLTPQHDHFIAVTYQAQTTSQFPFRQWGVKPAFRH